MTLSLDTKVISAVSLLYRSDVVGALVGGEVGESATIAGAGVSDVEEGVDIVE